MPNSPQYSEEKPGRMAIRGTRRSTGWLINFFVSRRAQRLDRSLQVLRLDQHIIGIKGRDREDRNLRFRKRLQERRQHTGHHKRKRPFQLQRQPTALGAYSIWNAIFGTNDGEFIACAHHAEEFAFVFRRPSGNAGIGGKPTRCQTFRKNTFFQMVCKFKNVAGWFLPVFYTPPPPPRFPLKYSVIRT